MTTIIASLLVLSFMLIYVISVLELRRLKNFSNYLKSLMDEGKEALLIDQEYMASVLQKLEAQKLTIDEALAVSKTFDKILIDSKSRVRELELIDIDTSFKNFRKGFLFNWDYAGMVAWNRS